MPMVKNTTIEVPTLLVAKGKRLGYGPVDLIQLGVQTVHGSLLPAETRTHIIEVLKQRKVGLLLVIGVIGSQYNGVAREIMSMVVKDETRSDCTPLVFCKMVTRSDIMFATAASNNCLIIASYHCEDRLNVQNQISSIASQEASGKNLNLIGIVEATGVYLEPTENVRIDIDVHFYSAFDD